MANTRSNLMADLLASPIVFADPHLAHGRLRAKVAEVAVAAADVDGHFYPLARFNQLDRILAALVWNTAITGGTDYDLGVYTAGDWTAADQAAKDADILFDGQTMAAERDALTDAVGPYGEGTNALGPASHGDPLHTLAGDAVDTVEQYDVALTANVVGTVAGTIVVVFIYTAGD